MNHNRFDKFFLFIGALSLLFLGLFVIFSVAKPLIGTRAFESAVNEVLKVHTSSYRKGSSLNYPIGALEWGSNNFRIENKSNEKVYSYFVLQLENLWCESTKVVIDIDGTRKNEVYLNVASNSMVKVPLEIDGHENIFINLNLNKTKNVCEDVLSSEYPISIYEWKFSEK
jgi:hypothetical protein